MLALLTTLFRDATEMSDQAVYCVVPLDAYFGVESFQTIYRTDSDNQSQPKQNT